MTDYRSAEAQAYRAWYKRKAWLSIRAAQLATEPLCRMCSARGIITGATVCDHIENHKGDWDKFISGPFQSLCGPCHSAPKQSEDRRGYSTTIGISGWPADPRHPANGGKHAPSDGLGAMSHPEWFRKVHVPTTIVCGPPASGKSTYVRDHARSTDLVLDLDAIAMERFSQRARHITSAQRLDCLRIRNDRLGDIMRANGANKYTHCWLIVAEPKPERRQWWVDRLSPHKVMVFAIPADVCLARATHDEAEGKKRGSTIATSIADWWKDYAPRIGDEVIYLAA